MSEPSIKVTSSFLINLMNFARQHVSNDLQAQALLNGLKLDKTAILTDRDLAVFAANPAEEEETEPGRTQVKKQPTVKPEQKEVVFVKSPEEVLVYMEKFLDSYLMSGLSAKDAVRIANSFIRHIGEGHKLTPENILGELKATNKDKKFFEPEKTMDEHLQDAQQTLRDAGVPGTFPLSKTGPSDTELKAVPDRPGGRKETTRVQVIDEADLDEV